MLMVGVSTVSFSQELKTPKQNITPIDNIIDVFMIYSRCMIYSTHLFGFSKYSVFLYR